MRDEEESFQPVRSLDPSVQAHPSYVTDPEPPAPAAGSAAKESTTDAFSDGLPPEHSNAFGSGTPGYSATNAAVDGHPSVPPDFNAVPDVEANPGVFSAYPNATGNPNLAADSYADLRTAHEFPDLHRTTTRQSRRSHIVRSVRSIMHGSIRRSAQGTQGSIIKEESETSSQKEKEPEHPQTAEEYEKQQQDPQHLLDTILEDHSTDSMAQIGDIAAEVSSSAGLSTDSSLMNRRKGYHENLIRNRRLRRYTKTSRRIQKLRGWYQKILDASLLIRLFVWWLPIAIILFIPLAVDSWPVNHTPKYLGQTRVKWIFIWTEVAWAALFISKIFAHYVPELFAFLISILQPKLFKFTAMLVALELPIQLLVWTFISFISFSPILYDNAAATAPGVERMLHWQKIVQDVLVCFLVSSIVFFCEQVFLYFLSTNFHRTRMALRIQAQKKAVNTLIILLNFAYKYFPFGSDEFEEEDRALYFHNLSRAKHKSEKSKLKGMKGFSKLSNAMENAAANVSKFVADTRNPESAPPAAKTVKNALSSKETTGILADRIWKSLVTEDSDSLTYEDLIEVFGEDRKEEVLYMFDILDKDGNNGIELDEMRKSVVGVNREGKAIAKSLVDMDGAIKKLHHLLLFLCLIIIIIIFVGILAPSTSSVLATLGSTLLSMSWLFASTAQEVFNSCIFLFVKHPFDVNDWVLIVVPGENGGGTTRMQVTELNLTYTVFTSVGVNVRIQTSNAILNSTWIENLTRSGSSQVAITIQVGIPETRMEQLSELEYRLNEMIEDNPREFVPGLYFEIATLGDLDRVDVAICVNTRINQDDVVAFAKKRTHVINCLARFIAEIGIMVPRRTDNTYTDPALPLYQYKVSDAKEAAEFTKQARGLRKPYGLLPPLSEVPADLPSDNEDGYVDSEVMQSPDDEDHENQPLYGRFHPFADEVRNAASDQEQLANNQARRPSLGSRNSYASRASSRASQNARGLRSRRRTTSTGSNINRANLSLD